jgi:hypothetical protein
MMPKIHSTPTSRGISGTLLIVYLLYSMFSLGIPVMLVSFALGMIVYSVYDSIELATAITVVIGVVLSFTPLTRRMSKEGFTTGKEGEKNDTPPAAPAAPAATEKKAEEKPATATAATATPAIPTATGGSTTATPPTNTSGFKDIKASTASSLTSGSEAAPAAAAPAAIATPAGQFKLGEIPKDEKGGFYIDQGTTLMNALNGLKPDQIKSMTQDTRQLLDTQKSLMGMLDSLAPMMKESSSLLNMFQTMFGTSPAMPGAGAAAGSAPPTA